VVKAKDDERAIDKCTSLSRAGHGSGINGFTCFFGATAIEKLSVIGAEREVVAAKATGTDDATVAPSRFTSSQGKKSAQWCESCNDGRPVTSHDEIAQV